MTGFINKSYLSTEAYPSHTVLLQQDTIPQKSSPDTTVSLQGINPLFLQLERKAREVEVYREQAIRLSQIRAARQPKKVVDTTCHWCPKDRPLSLQELLTTTDQKIFQFFSYSLYDKQFYIEHIGTNSPVFIEIEPSHTKSFVSRIEPIQRFEKDSSTDWFFLLLLSVSFLIGFIFVFYRKHISTFFQAAFFYINAARLHKEGSELILRLSMLFDIIFFITISIFVAIGNDFTGNREEIQQQPLLLAAFFLGGLILYRSYRFAIHKLIGLIAGQYNALDEIFYNQLLYPRIFSILLFPLLTLFTYSIGFIQKMAFYSIFVILIIVIALRFLRTFRVFIEKGFSIFYFLLYLCALEIVPVFVIIKELFGF